MLYQHQEKLLIEWGKMLVLIKKIEKVEKKCLGEKVQQLKHIRTQLTILKVNLEIIIQEIVNKTKEKRERHLKLSLFPCNNLLHRKNVDFSMLIYL